MTYYEDKAIELLDRIPLDSLARYMDDDLREQAHVELAPCSDLEFLVRYLELHEEMFGEEFEIN